MNIYDKKIRTIKFRGKTPQGKWVYGYYLIREEESPVIETSVPYTIHYIVDYADFNGLNENEILPETLGQFSGVYTIGNKEIYEGDILKYKYLYDRRFKYLSLVKFMETEASFGLKDIYGNEIPLYRITANNYFEVIGNIYENPELLNLMEGNNG